MTTTNFELPTKYDPKETEAKWREYWENQQIFKADPQKKGTAYSIVIPPPNVTGSLHMGHAFETALIDTLVRYHRMKGDNTLCLPGTDHASIAVHAIIDKQLKEEGKTRYDLGREEFLRRAWEWRNQSGGQIVNQLKALGLSADWSRECFTLDETRSTGVIEAFIKLYEAGLIYRGKYLVNWCPASESAVSDLEVENKEVDGHLWHFRYPLVDGSGYVEVATTRPETMLGDTAVAVNPHDSRYKEIVGKKVIVPLVEREIPIIADEFVEANFGTGCVKVTPAHDPNDFEMGQRHQLPMINIMNTDGTLNENAGDFCGQDRFVARKNVVKALEKADLLVKIENYRHTVPYSDRGKVPVEPLLSTQWFVKIEPLAQKALQELDNQNSPYFVPERWKKVYRDWLVKLKDWCISRQLWWGHQIPAWFVVSETAGEITNETPFIVAKDELAAVAEATAKYGEGAVLIREPDVLDTWFSSGLWPFVTLGWPQNTPELERYYPNSTLVTGFDIIFFWVARMTMMAGYFTDVMPFTDVYIHGLVRDENGKKMSKSANNGIDPLLLIDKYGTDALRYTLIKEVAGAGQDITLQYKRETDESESVEASRNFANKLWNASRFVLLNLDGKSPQELGKPDLAKLELSDRWILSRFNQVVKETRENIEAYGLGEAAKALYEFSRGDFCDWYIELVKPRLQNSTNPESRLEAQQVLAYVLEGILKLLHPFMPYITEEIWHTLTQTTGESLALQPYPQLDELLPEKSSEISLSQDAKEIPEVTKNIWSRITEFLGDLPQTISQSYNNYQKSLAIVGLIILSLISFRIILVVSKTLHQLSFVALSLRTLGLGWTIWFIWRYLLFQENRQELSANINQLKIETFGQPTSVALPPVSPVSPKPINTLVDTQLETEFDLLIGVIRTIRNLRAEAEIKPGLTVPVILQTENAEEQKILTQGEKYIQDLGKVESLTITPNLQQEVKQASAGVIGTIQVLIPLQGIIDVDAFKQKLEKKLKTLDNKVSSLSDRLNNPKFTNKAPVEVVTSTQNELEEAQIQSNILQKRLERLY